MTITFPRTDVLTAVGFANQQNFLPVPRQELGPQQANGVAYAIDFGSALWAAGYTSEAMLNDDAVDYEALLNSLDGVIQRFEAFDKRRPGPRMHKDGSANNGVLLTINDNSKAISLSGLKANQIVSRGDYLSWDYGTNRALHQASETIVANGDGVTAEFEIRPHVREGVALGAAVNMRAPRGIFAILPSSVSSTTSGPLTTITFQIGQVIE